MLAFGLRALLITPPPAHPGGWLLWKVLREPLSRKENEATSTSGAAVVQLDNLKLRLAALRRKQDSAA
jgi:hypothetical protein